MKPKIIDLPYINRKLADESKVFVLSADQEYYDKVVNVAEQIRDHRNERPIILLSGPSGSGKTTTARILEQILDKWGLETHALSMDNYFMPLTREQQALAARGELDLESPNRMDAPFLNEQLKKMVSGESVDLPVYDFKESRRIFPGRTLIRKPGELVIFEGIHALNPDVITIPDENTAKVYISVRTRVKSGGIVLHPAKIRLLRRMIRDKRCRNRSFEETIEMFPSVEKGESKYIMPHKYRASYELDTFIGYELNVYRSLLGDEFKVFEKSAQFEDLLNVLAETESMEEQKVPKTSLIREFIGNGQFED